MGMNFLERTGTSLLMSTLLCAPARSDDSTKQPSYEDILELLLEAEKRVKEAKTEKNTNEEKLEPEEDSPVNKEDIPF